MSTNDPLPRATKATYKRAIDTINAAAVELTGKTMDELIATSNDGANLDMDQVERILALAMERAEADKDGTELARLGFFGVLP
jgi:hypothetical protein